MSIFHFPFEIYLRIILSMLVGIIISFQRTVYNKPAGIRTFSLVSLVWTPLVFKHLNPTLLMKPGQFERCEDLLDEDPLLYVLKIFNCL